MPSPTPPGLILQHEETAPADLFGEWADERGIAYEVLRIREEGLPSDPSKLGWICALGSDATPDEPDPPAWVDEELACLRGALAADVPILGLCFGGQALAAAAGARVRAADPPEVGWFGIETTDRERVPAGPWLHFHYAQLELPLGATELARSPAGVAAFGLGRSLGLQFHPEVRPEIATGWAIAERERIEALGIRVEDVAAGGERHGAAARAAAKCLFDAWWRGAHEPEPRS